MTEEAMEKIFGELKNESDSVVSLAYVYAKNFENFGEDVTRRWQTTALQTDALNRAYKKGFDDAVERMRNEIN